MNVNLYLIEDYENETTLRPKKTNPNKPNSNPVLSAVEWANLRKAKMSLTSLAKINSTVFALCAWNQRLFMLNFNRGKYKRSAGGMADKMCLRKGESL